jgi:hypothetical protein
MSETAGAVGGILGPIALLNFQGRRVRRPCSCC